MTRKELYDEWIKQFCKDVPRSLISRHVLKKGNFLWHIFSWKLLPDDRYFYGKKAKEAYNSISKRGALYIDWFEDDFAHEITTELKDADAFDQFVEAYVVGKNFEWTYIKTHEEDLGPYFMKR